MVATKPDIPGENPTRMEVEVEVQQQQPPQDRPKERGLRGRDP